MTDYSKDIADSYAAILDAGIVCQLSRDGATIDVPALLLNFSRRDNNFMETGGDIILSSDRKAIIPGGLERNPDKELDRFIVPPCDIYPDGAECQIVNLVPVAPGGQAIIWTLQLRV
jgi:hypothetical protein